MKILVKISRDVSRDVCDFVDHISIYFVNYANNIYYLFDPCYYLDDLWRLILNKYGGIQVLEV